MIAVLSRGRSASGWRVKGQMVKDVDAMLPSIHGSEGRMVQVTNVSAANPTVNIKTLQTGSYFMELYQPQTGKRYYTQFSKQ